MKKLLYAATAVIAIAAALPAQAVTLGGQNWTNAGNTLTLEAVVPGGNQPQNIQCVICGDNQPQQSATFGYTNFQNTGQPGQDLRYFSTNVSGGGNPGLDTVGLGYDGSFLRAYLQGVGDASLNFSIGIDLNQSNTPQTLESFYMLNLTTHTVLASFNTPTVVPTQNNGTGFPDYMLTGFNLALGSDISIGDQIIFFARLSNANDGPDSFFLVPQQVAETPLPAAVWMFLSGMVGLYFMLTGKRRKPDIHELMAAREARAATA